MNTLALVEAIAAAEAEGFNHWAGALRTVLARHLQFSGDGVTHSDAATHVTGRIPSPDSLCGPACAGARETELDRRGEGRLSPCSAGGYILPDVMPVETLIGA